MLSPDEVLDGSCQVGMELLAMFHEISELRMVQADGAVPTPLAAGSAPGHRSRNGLC